MIISLILAVAMLEATLAVKLATSKAPASIQTKEMIRPQNAPGGLLVVISDGGHHGCRREPQRGSETGEPATGSARRGGCARKSKRGSRPE